jgi:hypothetical protein
MAAPCFLLSTFCFLLCLEMEVFYTSPWVPAEWIKAHGVEPRGIWLANEFAGEPLPLVAGVCAFANAAVHLAERRTSSAVIFTTHCDQLRRGFDTVAEGATQRVFLFYLPVTWQTPVAERIYLDELRRLSRFLVELGGHAPVAAELVEIVGQYREARQRLLDAASWCSARAYADAVARFHLDGSVNLPAKNGNGRATTGSHIPLALIGGPLPQSQMPLLDAIERAGGRVVLNGTEAGERSLWRPQTKAAERSVYAAAQSMHPARPTSPVSTSGLDLERGASTPMEQLALEYQGNCVDVFQRPNTRLYDWLRERLTARRARGIVLWHYVGCDLWRAEAESLREAFGLPVQLLGAEETSPSRNIGRLEAFLESLR